MLMYLLGLTAVFIGFEFVFFLQWTNAYLGGYDLMAHHLPVPWVVLPQLIYFVLLQLAVPLFFTLVIWAMARLIGLALKLSFKKTEKLGFLLWVLGILTVLLANQHYFANSKFNSIVSTLLPFKGGLILLVIFTFIFFLAGLVSGWGLFKFSRKLFFLLVLIPVFYVIFPFSHSYEFPKNTTQPNIILIGIDSLRPDFLNYFGNDEKLPFIDDFLNQATVFSDAMTPLARTYPSWASLLTGLYPKHSGIRTDLQDHAKNDLSQTLPAILQKKGYQTIFATDETRFSNIDESLGFDRIISPPTGLNDFLIGSLNDFPFTNLLINTKLGRYLFPYSYGNRGVYAEYDPDAFLNLVESSLATTHQKPIFLAIHFCLPHYPYFWQKHAEHEQHPYLDYEAALQRADQQVGDFMKFLSHHKILDNAVVVLLSDHGETFGFSGDRITAADCAKDKELSCFYPASRDGETVDQVAGHGTDVLALAQYHLVLAFRFYEAGKNYRGSIPGLVSLLDIKPTLLALLKIKAPLEDGHSLVKAIQTGRMDNTDTDFMLETDFTPWGLRTVHPEYKNILAESLDYFEINPVTTKITVKPSMLKLIISSKQYADIYQHWILALYPSDKKMRTVLVNLETGEWTENLHTAFAKKSPKAHMLSALKNFYGKELTLESNL